MSLILGDNFSYQGAKPLDKRNQYDTVAAMAAVSDTVLYDGCLTFCLETGKTYQWLSTNTVDATLGKWREFSSGGGGSSDLAGLDDVDITAAAAGQILKYDDTEQKWVNSDQTIEIIEMSKAEFDELPSSEKNNGKTYFIPDAQGSEGGGGTSDYDDLNNKPSINNVELSGNKALSDLGIQEQLTVGDGIDITDGEISTDNMPSTDMSEVASPMPGVMSRLPILFDETGAERVVGWYKYADGTKKPAYEKNFNAVCPDMSQANIWKNVEGVKIDNADIFISVSAIIKASDGLAVPLGYGDTLLHTVNLEGQFRLYSHTGSAWPVGRPIYCSFQYTKTTDTAS